MIFKRVKKSTGVKPSVDRKRPAESHSVLKSLELEDSPQIISPILTTSIEWSEESDSSSRKIELKPQRKSSQKKSSKVKRHAKAACKDSDSDEYKSVSCASEAVRRESRRRTRISDSEKITGISGEEERLLTIAIKNSLREKNAKPVIELNEIEEMMTYRPTEDEFKDPIVYIETLYKEGASEYGCIKIIPPASFKPPCPLSKDPTMKLPSRYQTIQKMGQGKPFDFNSDGITLSDFKKKDLGTTTYESLVSQKKYDELEKMFWDFVENTESEEINVEYAADLPRNTYGTKEFEKDDKPYEDHPWNLNKMHLRHNSLLQFWKEKFISGITMSWIYVGMLFSSFCWHYEDIMLYSINYMHEGEGKIWYAIPEYHREKFERLAKEKLALLFEEDPNFLLNINVMINPAFLVENGVHVYRTVQKPGEIIVTFPESYHQGISVGFNVAEAINMACPSWMEYGLKAMKIYMATREKIPVFPVDWMLIENARHVFDLSLDLESLKKLLSYYEAWLQKELTERALTTSNFYNRHDWHRMLENRDEVEEDANEWYYCINLWYASYVKCLNCNRKYWIGHELICKWPQERIKIVYRYSNDELNQFLGNLKSKISELES